MTQFRSQYGLCLTATGGYLTPVISDDCEKDGTQWSAQVTPKGEVIIRSQYGTCLVAHLDMVDSDDCELTSAKWTLESGLIKSNFLQKKFLFNCNERKWKYDNYGFL